ncbi:MAG: PD-(D/E)XK nuclease domain-containing protein [Clostridiales bacterium]|jgi:hypothetical protein|nr:PD-(D/E)XK nuclease domain-containing protein [Clostridiales bacterium]
MTPRKADGIGVLMEFKKLGKGEDVGMLLERGLGQSNEKQYALELKLRGIRYIVYTMVFDGKVCRLRLKR